MLNPGSEFKNDPITADNVIGSVISRQLTISRSDRVPRSHYDPGDPARHVDQNFNKKLVVSLAILP